MLQIKDLITAKELDREAMKKLLGGGWLMGSGYGKMGLMESIEHLAWKHYYQY
jgi:hypothetical protein